MEGDDGVDVGGQFELHEKIEKAAAAAAAAETLPVNLDNIPVKFRVQGGGK